MSDALPLPPKPSLEQYKKLSKNLQEACKSGDPLAIRRWAADWLERLAQLHTADWRENEPENIQRRWNQLKGTVANVANCRMAGVQFFIAREHGFKNWPSFARHIEDVGRADATASAFEAAADAIVSGDTSLLTKLLSDHPGLARERSARDHRSTLLHYVSANGVEDFRQKTPNNIVEITNILLDAGAEVDAESEAYGGGCTALGLVATSVHPEKAGVQIALLQTLLNRGASLQAQSGGNGHSIVHGCVANGQPGAAQFLADRGAPLDMESAASLGRLDVLETYFDADGARVASANPKQIESAFLYACGYGSVDVVKFLLERGVDPAAHDEQGQTALHWAGWSPQPEVIRVLLEHGAPVDAKDVRFDATPLDVVLWTWNNAAEDEVRGRCYLAIALLVGAGTKLDPDHWRDAEKGSLILERINSDSRMQAVLRGE